MQRLGDVERASRRSVAGRSRREQAPRTCDQIVDRRGDTTAEDEHRIFRDEVYTHAIVQSEL